MKYTGQIYRPPFEARSLLLQVTTGCSHNACAFCTMYRETPFSVETMEQIEKDLKEASRYQDYVNRIFLENGDPFVLKADKLLQIAALVRRYLPYTQTIAMYASIQNIRAKTDAELKALREAGVNELNIGVESGCDAALRAMNKGYTAAEAVYELKRLRAAGFDYGINIILGAAGPEGAEENARATAKLLNETQPYLVFTGTLHADPGCPLYDDLQSGAFRECTVGEYFAEQELLLSLLELERCRWFGLHPSNITPLQGNLPNDKYKLLHELQRARARTSPERLNRIPVRGGEGAILL